MPADSPRMIVARNSSAGSASERHLGRSLAMKSFIRSQTGRRVRQADHQIIRRPRGDSYDLGDIAFLEAAFDSVRYQQSKFPLAEIFANNLDLLTHAMDIRKEGLILEFGVASGRTIRHLASLTSQPIYGF